MLLPLFAKGDDVLGQRVQALTVVAEGQQIGLLGNEMGGAVLVDETDGDDVVAFAKQSFGYVITAWGVLVIGAAHLSAINISNVGVEERAKQQSGRLSGVSLVNLHVLPQPHAANASPAPLPLVDLGPLRVVVAKSGEAVLSFHHRHARVALIEQLVPAAVGLLVGLLLGANEVGIIV